MYRIIVRGGTYVLEHEEDKVVTELDTFEKMEDARKALKEKEASEPDRKAD